MAKKKILGLLLSASVVLALGSCEFNEETTNQTTSVSQTVPTGQTTSVPTSTPTSAPSTTNTATNTATNTSNVITGQFTTPEISQIPNTPVSNVKFEKQSFGNSLKKDGPLTQEMFPSIGENNLLVIPVNLDSTKKSQALLNDINIAFNGTEEQTGWESVSTFYKKSSYNKLDIKADVLNEWFTPSKSASYYETYYDNATSSYGSTLILREALAYYETSLDLSKYDNDNDGIIDSIWLVYNCAVNYESDDSDYWAYVYWNLDSQTYDGLEAYTYGFAGTDFMYETETSYPTDGFIVDAHTFIHETGHMMGLDDYYDYNSNVGSEEPGLYGADMMDMNIGDHGAISKMLLGWVDPIVVSGTGSGTIDLSVFTTTGQVLLVSNKTVNSIYEEYFLIEFYANVGLNQNDEPIYDGYQDAVGVRVLHVDAQKYMKNGEVDWNPDDSYSSGFLYNNSGTTHKFVTMLAADESTDQYCYGDSLFTPTNAIFGKTVYSNYKYHTGAAINFSFTVNSMSNSNCNLTITLK